MTPWSAIPLSGKVGRGLYVLVDNDDLPLVVGRFWHLRGMYYAASGKLLMHRVILGAKPGQIVDHINSNGLDNRRCNIRICTQSQNSANARNQGKLDYMRGITFTGRRWMASCIHGEKRRVGYADTAEEAGALYDAFARELHGPFARLNFPGPGERGLNDIGSRTATGLKTGGKAA